MIDYVTKEKKILAPYDAENYLAEYDSLLTIQQDKIEDISGQNYFKTYKIGIRVS